MGGDCLFNDVNFHHNRIDYRIDRDWGAAILNTGNVICINCHFSDNYAKNGGAIFMVLDLEIELYGIFVRIFRQFFS